MSPVEIINRTPHPVVILERGGPHNLEEVVERFAPRDPPIRLESHLRYANNPGDWPTRMFGGADRDTPEIEGTYYIVSLVTALAVRRGDFLVPDEEVRDSDGRIIGCRRLARVA